MKAGSEVARSNGPLRVSRKAGRKRRAAGWTLLTLGGLIAGVWAASGWLWVARGQRSNQQVTISDGSISWVSGPAFNDLQGWGSDWHRTARPRWEWWYGWKPAGERGTREFYRPLGLYRRDILFVASTRNDVASVLLWPVPLLLWATGALLLRSGIIARRRTITGKCKACGYDLAGLHPTCDAKCPECGRQAETFV